MEAHMTEVDAATTHHWDAPTLDSSGPRWIAVIAATLGALYHRLEPDWVRKFAALSPSDRLRKIERGAVVAIGMSPLAMMTADRVGQCHSTTAIGRVQNDGCASGMFRGSISAYYNMIHYEWFLVPLAATVLLLLMNGLLRNGHWWNVLLGLALLGVIMFDKDDNSRTLHFAFAVLFFVGNVAVFLFAHWRLKAPDPLRTGSHGAWQTREMRLRIALAVSVGVSMLLWRPLGLIDLLVAEWLSLGAICIHFWRDEAVHHGPDAVHV